MCLSVSKDLANRWIYMALLYSVFSRRSHKVYNYFRGKSTTTFQEKLPLEKNYTLPRNLNLKNEFSDSIPKTLKSP